MRGRGTRARAPVNAGGGAVIFLPFVVLFFGSGSAFGQESGRAPVVIGGDGRAIPHPPTAQPEATDEGSSRHGERVPALEHRSILLDLNQFHMPVACSDTAIVSELAP